MLNKTCFIIVLLFREKLVLKLKSRDLVLFNNKITSFASDFVKRITGCWWILFTKIKRESQFLFLFFPIFSRRSLAFKYSDDDDESLTHRFCFFFFFSLPNCHISHFLLKFKIKTLMLQQPYETQKKFYFFRWSFYTEVKWYVLAFTFCFSTAKKLYENDSTHNTTDHLFHLLKRISSLIISLPHYDGLYF